MVVPSLVFFFFVDVVTLMVMAELLTACGGVAQVSRCALSISNIEESCKLVKLFGFHGTKRSDTYPCNCLSNQINSNNTGTLTSNTPPVSASCKQGRAGGRSDNGYNR